MMTHDAHSARRHRIFSLLLPVALLCLNSALGQGPGQGPGTGLSSNLYGLDPAFLQDPFLPDPTSKPGGHHSPYGNQHQYQNYYPPLATASNPPPYNPPPPPAYNPPPPPPPRVARADAGKVPEYEAEDVATGGGAPRHTQAPSQPLINSAGPGLYGSSPYGFSSSFGSGQHLPFTRGHGLLESLQRDAYYRNRGSNYRNSFGNSLLSLYLFDKFI